MRLGVRAATACAVAIVGLLGCSSEPSAEQIRADAMEACDELRALLADDTLSDRDVSITAPVRAGGMEGPIREGCPDAMAELDEIDERSLRRAEYERANPDHVCVEDCDALDELREWVIRSGVGCTDWTEWHELLPTWRKQDVRDSGLCADQGIYLTVFPTEGAQREALLRIEGNEYYSGNHLWGTESPWLAEFDDRRDASAFQDYLEQRP